MELSLTLSKFISPEILIYCFDWLRHSHQNEVLHLYFEEPKVVPKEVEHPNLIARGFHKKVTTEDFPLLQMLFIFTQGSEDGKIRRIGKSFKEIGV